MFRAIQRRFWATLRPAKSERYLHEEFQEHLDTLAAKHAGRALEPKAQVFVESALLAAFGTAAGIAVAYAIQKTLLSFLNRTIPEIHQLHIALDWKVMVFVVLTSVISVLLFGTAPAFQAARTAALGSSAGNTRAGVTLRRAFVVAQIALSFIVLLSAGLLAGTLRNLKTLNLGYRPDEIAMIEIRPAAGGYSGASANQFYARIVERVRVLAGVKAPPPPLGLISPAVSR